MCCHGTERTLIEELCEAAGRPELASKLLQEIRLSEIELKYIVTCHHTPNDRKRSAISTLRALLRSGERVALPVYAFCAFSMLGRKMLEGIGQERSVQSYFEGMEDWCHNPTLYKLLGNRLNEIPGLREHVRYCCVRLAELREGNVREYSPFGVEERSMDEIDWEFSRGERPAYFTMHANSFIRGLDPKDPRDRAVMEGLKKLPDLWKGHGP